MSTGEAGRAAAAASFGRAAAEYERGRPSYPAQAVGWLLPAGARRVVDVGAGTGKLTRLLAARGLDVVAVEPSEGMREQFRRCVPGVKVLPGSAEDIPLPDGSADVVLFAQAWHWADPPRALPEVARVLAQGGRLGLLWNIRDERVAWVAELSRVIHGLDVWDYARPPLGAPFGPPERHEVAWADRLTRDALIDMVLSRSYVITAPADERDALVREVIALLEQEPGLAGDIALPYRTLCTRADLPR